MRLSGTTGSQGNSWVISRLMTTKSPLVLVQGELAYQLRESDISLHLHWAPREQNEVADALTNGDGVAFAPERRIEVDLSKVEFLILPELARVSEEIYQSITGTKQHPGSGVDSSSTTRKRVKLRARDPWGVY